jgi:Rieske 2Fe-2S family protein
MPSEELARLVQSHRAGFSLAQEFYRSPAIFAAELDRFLAAHWFVAGHVSEIPRRGDYFVLEGLDSSVIVTRGADGAVHALHNVCRHRGAKICEQQRGRAALFTCRYHGWSYHTDGSLAAWRHMPEGLERATSRCVAAASRLSMA